MSRKSSGIFFVPQGLRDAEKFPLSVEGSIRRILRETWQNSALEETSTNYFWKGTVALVCPVNALYSRENIYTQFLATTEGR